MNRPWRHSFLLFLALFLHALSLPLYPADEPKKPDGQPATSDSTLFDTAGRYAEIEGWKFTYAPLRKELHNQIIDRRLLQGTRSDKPTIIFTAGPPGAGKSVVIDALQRASIIDPSQFLWIDPDEIKKDIPEYESFKKIDSEKAASMVHRESGHVQEQLLERALKSGKNIIVDGTLSGKEWWKSEFQRIRGQYPNHAISIIYVSANQDTLLQRVDDRGKATGRYVPHEFVLKSQQAVVNSVKDLKGLTDYSVEISNDSVPRIISFYKEGKETPVQQEVPLQSAVQALFGPRSSITYSAANTTVPLDLKSQIKDKRIKAVNRDNFKEIAKHYKVVFVNGYSELGYENPAWAKAYIARLMAQNGDGVMYVMGGTPEGIGQAYDWIPKIAAQMGLKDIKTAGILPAGNPLLANQDYLLSLPPAADPIRARVDLAAELNGELVALKGDEQVGKEVRMALSKGLPVTLVRDRQLQPRPEAVAAKLIGNPTYQVDGTKDIEKELSHHENLNLLRQLQVRDKWEIELSQQARENVMKMGHQSTNEVLHSLLKTYPELLLLGNAEVIGTPEGQSGNTLAPAPASDRQAVSIDRATIQEKLKWLTNAPLPKEIYSPTQGVAQSFSEQVFGSKFAEFDRATMNILCLKWMLEGNYEQFTAAQGEKVRLTRDQFSQMHRFALSVLRAPEDRDAMITFLLFNNLGKSKQMIDFLKTNAKVTGTNHQNVLAEVLRKYPFVTPSFLRLDPMRQKFIIESLETDFNMGQFIQGENAAGNLKELSGRSEGSMNFYLVTSLVKLAGAAGHVVRNGSVVMDGPTYGVFKEGIESLSLMHQGHTASQAYDDFLGRRAHFLAMPMTGHDGKEDSLRKAATRLSLLMRFHDSERAKLVLDELGNMPEPGKSLLVKELNQSGVGEGPAILLYYAPATLKNIRDNFAQAGVQDLDRATIKTGLALMAKLFSSAREHVNQMPQTGGVVQIRLDDIAKSVRTEPGATSSQPIRIYMGSLGWEAKFGMASSGSSNVPDCKGPLIELGRGTALPGQSELRP